MALDEARLRFGGAAMVKAEELGGSFRRDESDEFANSLYEEFRASDSVDARKWLGERLPTVFISAENPPRWIERYPDWPFLNGRPMIFLHQFTVPENSVAERQLIAGAEIYVFGARSPRPSGWEMVYTTVEQHRDLP